MIRFHSKAVLSVFRIWSCYRLKFHVILESMILNGFEKFSKISRIFLKLFFYKNKCMEFETHICENKSL